MTLLLALTAGCTQEGPASEPSFEDIYIDAVSLGYEEIDTADTRYQYDLPTRQWVTFPLADGSGSYTVKVLEQTSSDKYGTVVDATFKASLSHEFAPFIRPNQYVNYSSSVSPKAISEAQSLVGSETDPLKKVEKSTFCGEQSDLRRGQGQNGAERLFPRAGYRAG